MRKLWPPEVKGVKNSKNKPLNIVQRLVHDVENSKFK